MVDSGPGNIRKKQVLFVHCGGTQGLHEGSSDLVAWLKMALGPPYEILYPEMPNPDQPVYEEWKKVIQRELELVDPGVILIGHSIGGSVILKFLSEEKISKKIDGVFLIGPPYWGKKSWNVKEYILEKGFESRLPGISELFIYHSRNDAVVPFKHLSYYAKHLPFANLRELEGREHLFSSGLPEMARDIRSLNAIRN